MKNLLRHISSWLLIFGVAASFFAFLNGEGVYQNIKNAQAEVNNYRYKEEYEIYIYDMTDVDSVIAELKKLSGNVTITDINAYLEGGSTIHLVDILLKNDEDFVYSIDYLNNDGDVIIGESIKDYCEEGADGSLYLEINGCDYKVWGIISEKNSTLMNGEILLKYDSIEDAASITDADYLTVSYGSWLETAEDSFNSFYMVASDICSVIYEKNAEKYVDVGSENSDEQFYMIIALFSMINCIVISEFWIIRRKQEMIIRKLWGFSNKRLFSLMYREILSISGIAVSFVLIFQLALYILSSGKYGGISVRQLLIGVIFVIISALIIVIRPINQAANYKISDGTGLA